MDHAHQHNPNLQRQSLAVDFIDNRLDKYHPAFSTPPSRYDPALGGFVVCCPPASPPSPPAMTLSTQDADMVASTAEEGEYIPPRPLPKPTETLGFWDLLFPRAMDAFREAHPEEPALLARAGYRIRDQKSWVGVYDQLEAARQSYSSVDKGFKGGFRKVYRKLADNVAPPLSGAVKFVPDIDYVTPILGAVQILLEAAKKAAKVREAVLGGFDDIDTMLSQIELFLHIFVGDENIEKASVSLISATFHAIECVVEFFAKHVLRRAISATFKGADYQQEITAALSAVKTQSQSLIREADNSGKYEVSMAMREMLNRTATYKSELQKMRQDQQIHFQEHRNLVKRLLDECAMQRAALLNIGWRQDQDRVSIMYQLSRSPSPAPPLSTPSPTDWHVDPQHLLDWLDIPDLASRDMERMEETRHTRVPPHERARAEQLVQTGQVQEWLRSPSSAQLLVLGNYDERRRVSGLSLLCVSLARSLAERAPQFLHLEFFCGLHADAAADPHAGGLAMVRSFLCQLLCQFDFGERLSASVVTRELARSARPAELCGLLERLVHLLPSHVVLVCLIDGILYYERPEFLGGMGHVLATVLRLSSEQTTQAAVKVLVTSPTRTCEEARRPFPDDLVVSMDAMALPGMVASQSRLQRQLEEEQSATGYE